MFHVPNKYRITDHPILSSTDEAGNNGAFKIELEPDVIAFVIASDGAGWEHVSVHIVENFQEETPVWEEMCRIKDMFWDSEDCVIQFHPPKSEYINYHSTCLHLWRPIGIEIPRPDSLLIGPKRKHK